MLVRFKTDLVPVRLLQQGAVVVINDDGPHEYYHITAFCGLGFDECTMDLKISDAHGVYEENSANLVWVGRTN